MRYLWRRVLRSDRLRRTLCWLISLYIRFVFHTGRWRVEGDEVPRRLHEGGHPFILAFWHGRLLMMPMGWDRARPIHMLISSHRDGRIIADAVKHFGISSIAGSTRRGGSAALRTMVKLLRGGACVGITPDGPRGPAQVASLGIVATARMARAPIVPLSYAARRRWLMPSWDRFHLALPFTGGCFLWGAPIEVPENADDAALETYRRLLEERLTALGEAADRWAGHRSEGPASDLSLPIAGEGS